MRKLDNWIVNHRRNLPINMEEVTVLESIQRLGNGHNEIIDYSENLNIKVDENEKDIEDKVINLNNKKVSHSDMLDIYKNNKGDHLGSWQGVTRPEMSEPGIQGSVIRNTDNINAITNIKLIENIDGTNYKKGMPVDFNYIKSLQIQLFSSIMRNFKKTNNLDLLFRGDSLTYGYDINSVDKRPPSENKTDTGKSHTRERASINFPESLTQFLRDTTGGNITFENLGISGAWVKYSFDEFYKNRTNKLEFIMLGTNDSRLEQCPYKGDIKQFIEYYEQLIIREILMGNGLILIKPMQTRLTKDIDIETFRIGVQLLGEKYGIPVLDGSEMLDSYEYTIWSDETHLNGEGYKTLGYRVGASILNEGIISPLKVKENSVLLMSPTKDSCMYKGDSLFYTASLGYSPNSIDSERVACRLNKNGEMIYSFYVEEDGLFVLPSMFMYDDSAVKIELDRGIKQAKTRSTHSDYKHSDWDGGSPSNVTIEVQKGQGAKICNKQNIVNYFGKEKGLKINNKGWHSLSIKNIGVEPVNLFGIEFLGSECFYRLDTNIVLFKSSTDITSGDIVLNNNIDDYNSLIIYYNFAGIGSTIVDFKNFNSHNIRLTNLSNTENNSTQYVGEMEITKKDDNVLTITRNKAIIINENGIPSNYTNAPISIRMIKGLK